MRPIRGPRHAADDERTLEAPAEEPTLSAGLDVRAAFEAQDKTVPGAVVGLVSIDGPIEKTSPGQQGTIPLVSPEAVLRMRAASQARLQGEPPRVAVPPPSDPVLPPPSDPVLVNAPRGEDAFAQGEDAVDIPGVGGAQRKRMLRIVIGVLSVCALLCVGALARQLLGSKESESSAPTSTATATAAATGTATATETPSATAAPSVVESAEPSAQAPVPSAPPVVASAAPAPPAPAPPPPPARARAPEPPPPARRPAPAAPAPHPRAAAAPAAPKGRPPIVRDSPF